MPLLVGSAYSEYSLQYRGLSDAVAAIKLLLDEARTGSGKFAATVESNNQRVIASFKGLQGALAGMGPFAPLVQQAQQAYEQVVAAGPIAKIRQETVQGIEGLRDQISRIHAFSGLQQGAAEAAQQTVAEMRSIEAETERLQERLASIGIPKAKLEQFFNEQGEFRQVLHQMEQQAQESATFSNTADFGKIRSRTAVEARMEGLSGNVPSTSEAQRALDEGDLKTLEALIVESKEGHAALATLNQDLRALQQTTASQHGLAQLGQDLTEASDAAGVFENTLGRLQAQQANVAELRAELDHLRETVTLATAATADESASEEQLAHATEVGLAAMQELDAAERRAAGAEQELIQRNAAHEESILRVADAQQTLNKYLADQPAAVNQAAQQTLAPAASTAPLTGELAKIEAQRARDEAKFAAQQEAQDREIADRQAERIARQTELQISGQQSIEQRAIAAETERLRIATESTTRIAEAEAARIGKTETAEVEAVGRIERVREQGLARVAVKETEDVTRIATSRIAADARVEAAEKGRLGRVEAATIAGNARIEAAAVRRPGADPEVQGLQTLAAQQQLAGSFDLALETLHKAEGLLIGDEKTRLEILRQIKSVTDEQTRANRPQTDPDVDRFRQFAREAQSAGDLGTALEHLGAAYDLAGTDAKLLSEIQTQANRVIEQQTTATEQSARAAVGEARARASQLADAREYTQALDQLVVAESNAVGQEKLLADIQRQRQQITRAAAGNEEGGAFANFGQELLLFSGYGSAALVAIRALQTGWQALKDGFKDTAAIETTRAEVGTLIGDVDLGNAIVQRAIDYFHQYGRTQTEAAQAVLAAEPVIRTSTTALDTQLSVLLRLQALRPGSGIDQIAEQLKQLEAGRARSVAPELGLTKQATQELVQEVESGTDVFKALDDVLTRQGVTMETVAQQTQGATGDMKRLNVAVSDLKITVGDYVSGPGRAFLQWLAGVAGGASDTLGVLKELDNVQRGANPATNIQAQQEQVLKEQGDKNPFIKFLEYATGLIQTEDEIKAHAAAAAKAMSPDIKVSDAFGKLAILNNQLDSGLIDAQKYQAGLAQIAQAAGAIPDDPLHVIQNAQSLGNVAGEISLLTAKVNEFRNAAAQNPALASKYLPEILAIEGEIGRLQALSPVDITIQLQVQAENEAAQAINGIIAKTKEANKALSDLDAQNKKAMDDLDARAGKVIANYVQQYNANNAAFGRQTDRTTQDRTRADTRTGQDRTRADTRLGEDQALSDARADRDVGRQIQQMRDDLNKTEGRQDRDYKAAQEAAEAEHTDRLVKIARDRDQELVKIARDTREKIQKEQGDFDVTEHRAMEDYEDDRKKLLAEGKIAEAAQLARKFQRDDLRRKEDEARKQSETVDTGDQQVRDRKDQATQQIADENASFNKAEAQRKAQYIQQRGDEEQDFRDQRDRANKARADQIADAAVDRQRASDRLKEDRKREDDRAQEDRDREDGRRKYDFGLQQQELTDNTAAQLAEIDASRVQQKATYDASHAEILAGWQTYVDEQTAKLTQAKDDAITIAELMKTGMSEEQAKALVDLGHAQDALTKLMTDNSEIVKQGAKNTALAWVTTYADELKKLAQGTAAIDLGQTPRLPPGPSSVFDPANPVLHPTLPSPNGSSSHDQATTPPVSVAPNTPRSQAGSAGTRSASTVHVTVPVSIALDGQTVAGVVAPHVTQHLAGDLAIHLQVTDASNNIGLHQPAFRSTS